MWIFTNDCSLDNIIEEQYILARRCSIGYTDSNEMPDFERKMIFGKLARDLKEEAEELKKKR